MCYVFADAVATESFSAYVYGKPAVVRQPTTTIGHVQQTQATPFVQRAAAPVEQQLAKSIQGRVTKINKDQGFGYLATDEGTLFFHQAQLIGCHYTELNAGDVMSFDVVYNYVSGKRIAKNVSFVEPAGKTIGHCQRMQAVGITTTNATSVVVKNQLNVTGTIVEVNDNHGFIDCDHELVFFYYNQLCGTIMSELKPGMTVGFNKMFNNDSKKLVAHSVKIVDQPQAVGHFLDMTVGVVQPAAVKPTTAEFTDKQLAYQTCERPAKQLLNSQIGHFIDMGPVSVAQPAPVKPTSAEFTDKQLAYQTCERPAKPFAALQNSQIGHFIDMGATPEIYQVNQPTTAEFTDKQLAYQACERPEKRSSSGLQNAKNLLQIEAAAFVRRLSSVGVVVVNELLEVPKEETAAAPRSRKGSIMSDLFLTPSGRSSRRGSIVLSRR